ncbi:MAG: mandelate racemase/muconate lactonizing enzyme family protein [Acidobacteriia bacterium]|nr:mandelate racemase/muconate lactonizing enzyme family protein [Terriglobia bacterium]
MRSLDRRSFFRIGGGVAGAFGMQNLFAAVQDNSTPYQRPKLKITDVKSANIQGFHVRIYTDQGLYGDGEGVDAVSGGPSILQGLRFSLVGQSPLNIEGIWERIRTSGIFGGAQAGQYVATLTAVEIALWDLAGKALNMPIYQLMGGKLRDRIRVYCDCGANDRNDPQAKTYINQIVENNFTMTKIDIDAAGDPARFDRVNWTANNAEIDHMVDKVSFMRESLPKTVELAVDMHGRYDLGTAKRVAKELEPFRLVWLEEPVPPENIDAMRNVRDSTHTPICCGENIYMRWGFRELFEKQAVDIIMPDIQKCGGLMEGKKIAAMAQTYYVPIAPHSQASPVGAMATAHMLATVPNFLVVEWHWSHPGNRWERWKNFVKQGEIIEKGHIVVPDKPGIGVEMNEEYLKKLPGVNWFPA